MWEEDCPDVDDVLRQGDLLAGVPFPKRGTMVLTPDGIEATMYPAEPVLVLDQCCTIDKKYTVLLARVRQTIRNKPDDPLMRALRNVTFEDGEGHAKYAHLLESPPTLKTTGRLWAADLLERVSLAVSEADQLRWLQEKRVARMTPQARAHVRLKMQFHFGEVAEEDVEELTALGLDKFGRPV